MQVRGESRHGLRSEDCAVDEGRRTKSLEAGNTGIRPFLSNVCYRRGWQVATEACIVCFKQN